MNMTINADSPVTVLSGCGKKRAEALASLGIYTVGQLIRHFPRGYQNRGDVLGISDASVGSTGAFVVTVTTPCSSVRLRGGRSVTKCKGFDGDKSLTLVFFNRPYIKDVIHTGCTYRLWGKLVRGKTGFEITPQTVEPVSEYKKLKDLIPLYPLASGLTQNLVSTVITEALGLLSFSEETETLTPDIREALGVCTESEAYRNVHCPKTPEDVEKGRAYFIAEELFVFACSVASAKSGRKSASVIKMDPEKSKFYDFTAALPFKLTKAQSKVISEIRKDMLGEFPMARLVSGDVGSGKTVCAAAAAFLCIRNGHQCALMAPTEILAAQHYRELATLFSKLGISCAFLSGSLSASAKRNVYAGLASGETELVIGTHALLSEGVAFKDLGLVITDEQHRFGVMQRAVLSGKGGTPHVLVMSATPIPRTLALIMCGDLDISVIDELPPGRQPVETLVVGEKHRERMNRFIGEQVKNGRQVYIVCPTVEAKEEIEETGETEEASGVSGAQDGEFIRFDFGTSRDTERMPELKSAIEYEKKLREEIFPQYRTAFIHGRMNGADKNDVMKRFADGEIDILVSTTVIEVGVNVPNATVMVVENAERFGLSQLHQLRGRVGRGSERSYCILVSDASGENARKRLEVMRTVGDGYKIAKYDLEMRGPGDLFASSGTGTRQHGSFGFRLAGLCTDTVLLEKAFALATSLTETDPELSGNEHKKLKEAIGSAIGTRIASIS